VVHQVVEEGARARRHELATRQRSHQPQAVGDPRCKHARRNSPLLSSGATRSAGWLLMPAPAIVARINVSVWFAVNTGVTSTSSWRSPWVGSISVSTRVRTAGAAQPQAAMPASSPGVAGSPKRAGNPATRKNTAWLSTMVRTIALDSSGTWPVTMVRS
jgi:hypothetical protein